MTLFYKDVDEYWNRYDERIRLVKRYFFLGFCFYTSEKHFNYKR